MGIAAGAYDFDPFHEETCVGLHADVLLGDGFPKTWPTGARIEFGLRLKQIVAAADALVNAFVLRFVILPREGPLRSLLTGYVKLLWCKQLLPFGLGFGHFVRHDESFLFAGIDSDSAPAGFPHVFLLCWALKGLRDATAADRNQN